MAEASNKKDRLHQNLVDAGCSELIVQQCIALAEDGKCDELQYLLKQYRQKLLETVHAGEKHIDCLDFLLYQIGRGNI